MYCTTQKTRIVGQQQQDGEQKKKKKRVCRFNFVCNSSYNISQEIILTILQNDICGPNF